MEKNSYNMCNDYMNDEIDICDTLKDSDDNICISDLIFEIAENNVPIDENTLYDKVWDAKEDIERVLSEGLCDTSNADLSLIIGVAIECHYEDILYCNLDSIAYNVLVDYFFERYGNADGTEPSIFQKVAESEIEDFIEEVTSDLNNDGTWKDLKNKFDEFMSNK